MRRTELEWLEEDEVLALQDELILTHGGEPGVRDIGLLQSALAAPKNKFAYGVPGIFDLAAAYTSGLTRNHPFLDGNKRTALVAAALFLADNGWDFIADEVRVVYMVLGLTNKKIGEAEFADWLKRNSTRMRQTAKRRSARHRLRHSRKKR